MKAVLLPAVLCELMVDNQMVAGFAEDSKYYPRGVISALWLLEE